MTELALATLQVLTGPVGNLTPKGDPVTVQFNPAALRYQLSNSVSVDKASGKLPVTQYLGTAAGTLSFDLIFDGTYPADAAGGPAGAEKYDVRRRLRPLQSMTASGVAAPGGAQAKDSAKKSTVPLVRFTYGTFSLTGLVVGLNIDFELFSEAGVPLQAKAAVTMKEVDPAFLANEYGAGANTGAAAQDPAKLTAGPASGGAGGPPARPTGAPPTGSPDDRSALARAGESAADLLQRMGRDASAWKDLSLPGINPLSLPAGVVIELPATLSAEVRLGVGATAGVGAGGPAGPAAALRDGADPRALTQVGGIQAAVSASAASSAATAAIATRERFDPPTVGASTARAGVAAAADRRAAGVGDVGSGVAGAGGRLRGIAPADRPDLRAQTFGTGVPLRELVGPRWSAGDPGGLRAGTPTRPSPGGGAGARRSDCGCGCGGGCGGAGGARDGSGGGVTRTRPPAGAGGCAGCGGTG